jgi:hypothetical protein
MATLGWATRAIDEVVPGWLVDEEGWSAPHAPSKAAKTVTPTNALFRYTLSVKH